MIIFKTVRWMNLLSTGNDFIEVSLNKHCTTLIVGLNGAGKSTILDAIFFALFNKPFRKVNRALIINSITCKNLMVEIEFEKAGSQYKVRRGIKPNIFEIYKDGELIDQNADNKDYQGYLESILGMNQKAFTQIVILGAASFVPFMQLTVPVRREVIEDFMDIQIFSDMNDILKKRVSAHKDKVLDAHSKLSIAQSELGQAEAANRSWQTNNEEEIEIIQGKIDEISTAAMEVVEKMEAEEATLSEIPDIDDRKEQALQNEKKCLEKQITELTIDIKRCQKEIEFLFKHDVCQTCHQKIDDAFKNDHVSQHEATITEKTNEGIDASAKLEDIEKQLQENVDIMIVYNKKKYLISEYQRELNWFQQQVVQHKQNIAKLKVKRPLVDTDFLQKSVKDKESVVEMCETMSQLLFAANGLLKDDGIKSVIIKQYIPVVNRLINKYLVEMDFFVDFHLNEAFEETIKSRHRDEFSYESFSEGQKMRIDLAILFAWREVAKIRNSAATNLLIFDEVLDSSLDQNGVEEFIRIIKSMASNENVFVISHRGDSIGDKFDHVLKFSLQHNFSKIEDI